ncbi:hypothetical protein BHD05_11190 [Marisediminicola antarctica]|uniref:Uncharacterized protein n=1 Tax=Marisediminicola antarctica TaxID=674079 RepID=A0A7L5ALV7_9MICO|nr:hypothetical protein BHD05_11190 [Marisediminicola antarctica]
MAGFRVDGSEDVARLRLEALSGRSGDQLTRSCVVSICPTAAPRRNGPWDRSSKIVRILENVDEERGRSTNAEQTIPVLLNDGEQIER